MAGAAINFMLLTGVYVEEAITTSSKDYDLKTTAIAEVGNALNFIAEIGECTAWILKKEEPRGAVIALAAMEAGSFGYGFLSAFKFGFQCKDGHLTLTEPPYF